MKKAILTLFLCILCTLPVFGADSNVDSGGGSTSADGTSSNFWNTGSYGVRVSIIEKSSVTIMGTVDFSNATTILTRYEDTIKHFGKKSKIAYIRDYTLNPTEGSYTYYNLTGMPTIFSSSGGNDIDAIRTFFAKETTLEYIALIMGFDYDTLIGGDYKLLIEPIGYFTYLGVTPKEAARQLGVHVSTVYRELKRGTYTHLNSDYTAEERYSPDIAHQKYKEYLRAKGAAIKLGKDFALAAHIEQKITQENYSPSAVISGLKRSNKKFSVTLSKPTLYRYITQGVFLGVTMADLPEKGRKKKRYKKTTISRAPRGESIENRPEEINSRTTFGHWEIDTVVSARNRTPSLLVLTERLTRQEIIMLMPTHTTKSVVRALNRLQRRYGRHFKKIFKSFTCVIQYGYHKI